jgi:hypothetical protein
LKVRDYLEVLSVDTKILLKWILKKQGVSKWTGFIWLRIETSGLNTVMDIRFRERQRFLTN